MQLSVMDSLDSVIEELTSILTSVETRDFFFDICEEIGVDPNLADKVRHGNLSHAETEWLLRVSVSATICRAVIAQVKADGRITPQEVQFATRALGPHLAIVVSSQPDMRWPDVISCKDDILKVDGLLRQTSRKFLDASGVGGRLASLPTLCALCDPFSGEPLLENAVVAIRQICTATAVVDGLSAPEQKVLTDFEELAAKCRDVSRRVRAQLPELASFDCLFDDRNSHAELLAETNRLTSRAAQIRRSLKSSTRQLRTCSRRIESNSRRNAQFIGDALTTATIVLIFACVVCSVGLGFLLGDITQSKVVGSVVSVLLGIVSVQLVAGNMLNIAWRSTARLKMTQRTLWKRRYQEFENFEACNLEITRLRELLIPKEEQKAIADRLASARQAAALVERKSEEIWRTDSQGRSWKSCPGCNRMNCVSSRNGATQQCRYCGELLDRELAILMLILWIIVFVVCSCLYAAGFR